jgi:hypothetical protein
MCAPGLPVQAADQPSGLRPPPVFSSSARRRTGSTARSLRGEETIEVFGGLLVEDVQVQRQNGRAFELGRHSSDNEKVDLVSE